jgi:hypothetical protein
LPRYLIERNFGRIDDEVMRGYGERSAHLVKYDFENVVWEHSHVVVGPDGTVKTFCIYLAPSEEVVYQHADELGGHTIESVYEIGGDVDPGDFKV